ncbi:uncharacterized protein [Euwallacea fornicatus]|uniref:uncharacterized protein n=1 Tax=Euwallacea fornicatus TaxID=995702 RepID=UPI00338F154E
MDKKRFNLNSTDDIEELNRLVFEEMEKSVTIADENFDESDDSEMEDYVEERLVDSDTDHEIDSQEECDEEDSDCDADYYSAKCTNTELDCWKLCFDNNILAIIVENTNIYIDSIRKKIVRERNCKPTDVIEMQAFFALLYLAGVFRGNHQNILDFWRGRIVVLLSSLHVSCEEVADDTTKKPEIIDFYNSTKSGVDIADKLCATYNVARSTKRWPMVIFYHMLNVAAINSRLIFWGNGNEYIFRREYIKKLVFSLLKEQLERRSQIPNLPPELKMSLAKYRPETSAREEQLQAATLTRKRKRCEPCYKETQKDAKTKYVCEKCNVYLCLSRHVRTICQNCLEEEIIIQTEDSE